MIITKIAKMMPKASEFVRKNKEEFIIGGSIAAMGGCYLLERILTKYGLMQPPHRYEQIPQENYDEKTIQQELEEILRELDSINNSKAVGDCAEETTLNVES